MCSEYHLHTTAGLRFHLSERQDTGVYPKETKLPEKLFPQLLMKGALTSPRAGGPSLGGPRKLQLCRIICSQLAQSLGTTAWECDIVLLRVLVRPSSLNSSCESNTGILLACSITLAKFLTLCQERSCDNWWFVGVMFVCCLFFFSQRSIRTQSPFLVLRVN